MVKIAQDPERRFWNNVSFGENCWIWRLYKCKQGYGRFKVSANRRVLAHRYAWEIVFGTIPEKLQICHKCDNPSCVRPTHLFMGTQKQNMKDMYDKGRNPSRKGENNPRAKLNEIFVATIRKDYETGDTTQIKLGNKYGVDNRTISAVILKKIWS